MVTQQLDEATKLYTSGFLDKGLEEIINNNKIVSFIYIKVEFIKEDHKNLVNLALKDIARIVRNQMRNVDFGVKLKDAVLIIMPGTSKQHGQKLLERIINKIESPGFLDGYTVLCLPKNLINEVYSYPDETKTKEEILNNVKNSV